MFVEVHAPYQISDADIRDLFAPYKVALGCHTRSLSHTNPHPLSAPLFLSLTNTPSLARSLSHTLSPSLSVSLAFSVSLSLSLSRSLSLSESLCLRLR